MQFSDVTNKQGLVQDVYFWTGTDSVSFVIAEITRLANFALNSVVSLIMRSDKRWEFDDLNFSDFPIGTQTLVVGQHDYSVLFTQQAEANTPLNIIRVKILGSDGYYYTISPINRRDIPDSVFDESNGLPRMYAKMGNSILLYPAPASGNVTLAKGLEVQFQRVPSYFAATDTTKEPGFNENYHRLIPLYISRDFCLANNITNRLVGITNEITRIESQLKKDYEQRSAEDTGNNLQMRGELYK